MNHSFYRVGLPALLLMPFSQALAAFDPATVGADSQWVVYADLNALRASVIGKQLVDFAEKAQADATKGVVGIDFQKLAATVGSMTAYGSNFSKDPKDLDGALIIQGTADLRKIAEAALVQATSPTCPSPPTPSPAATPRRRRRPRSSSPFRRNPSSS
jgi:hypothetical protein